MKRVDSDALGVVNRALGVSGSGAQETELTDGILEQAFVANPAIRRGRTLQPSEGIFYGVMSNEHGGAGTLTSFIRPYNAESLSIAPFPFQVPAQFDIWLLYCTVLRTQGSGTISAALDMELGAASQGWGVNDAGVISVDTPRHPLAFWDTSVSEVVTFAVLGAEVQPLVKLGIRLPRLNNPQLRFHSTASALAGWQCAIVMGLFPVSLGQDGIVGGE